MLLTYTFCIWGYHLKLSSLAKLDLTGSNETGSIFLYTARPSNNARKINAKIPSYFIT